jgi:catechol 2,3-dioxygenase-like lactoylglutathione lyase family enzyme
MAFYRDVLGLSASESTAGEVETPNVTLSFWNPEQDGEEFVPNTGGIAFRVSDVAVAVEELRAAGAEIIAVEDTGVCHMGFVRDPDGNTLILHRRYAPRD